MEVKAVVHSKKAPYTVYIGRPSKWGNPYYLQKGESRHALLEKYRAWILAQPQLLADLHELDGQVLGCWCAPKPCHGDVLAELVREIDKPLFRKREGDSG